MEIIGQGEVASLEIVKDMFGNSSEYLTQVKVSDMVSPEYLETGLGVSHRQAEKNSDNHVIDIACDFTF